MQDFNNKVAVITGGSSGVGRSLAFALGRLGAKVAVGDVDRNAMAQLRSDLAAENIEAIVEHCDVTSADSLNALAEKAAMLDRRCSSAAIAARSALSSPSR